MTVPNHAWVFDTGPLRHFAMQGWLGGLRFLAGGRPVYITDSVERELYDAAEHVSAARVVLDAGWINVHRSTSRDFIEAFAHDADQGRSNIAGISRQPYPTTSDIRVGLLMVELAIDGLPGDVRRLVVAGTTITLQTPISLEKPGPILKRLCYTDRLVAGGKNLGECGVLAMGQIYKCEVVIDDAIPRQIAKEKGIRITATVPLLREAVRAKKLTESKYYLPFGPGGFRRHVLEGFWTTTSFEHDPTGIRPRSISWEE